MVIAVLVVPIALLGVMLAMHAVEEWLEGGQPLRRTHEVIDAVRRRPVERAPVLSRSSASDDVTLQPALPT